MRFHNHNRFKLLCTRRLVLVDRWFREHEKRTELLAEIMALEDEITALQQAH